MTSFSCPSCGAALEFRSSVVVSAVCPFCQMLVVRRDVDVEAIGKVAALPPDMSPVQVGTECRFEGQTITIIGRRKMAWDDGLWNEWFIICDDGRKGWLAEAQGDWSIAFEQDPSEVTEDLIKLITSAPEISALLGTHPEKEPNIEQPFDLLKRMGAALGFLTNDRPSDRLLNSSIALPKHGFFTVVDIKRATCISMEGELPSVLRSGEQVICIDCQDENGGFVSLELSAELSVYVGRYLEWQEMKASNLRVLEGWDGY